MYQSVVVEYREVALSSTFILTEVLEIQESLKHDF